MALLSWLCLTTLVAVGASQTGSSLQGAVEDLQRRQNAYRRNPIVPPFDYDALYEFIPPGYPEPEYPVDVEEVEDKAPTKYVIKLLDDSDPPPETYEYKIIKKKHSYPSSRPISKKQSAFRERSHHRGLKDLLGERGSVNEINDIQPTRVENDAEYDLLLGELLSKYKNNKNRANNVEPNGVVKLYKDKIVRKRLPDNWGPIAFKRKRSSDFDTGSQTSAEYEGEIKLSAEPSSDDNRYEVTDDDKDDWRDEYAIAFQPLEDEPVPDITEEDQYSYNIAEKRFPVRKRSSGPYEFNSNSLKKRFLQNKNSHGKSFRSSSGTDPKIIKDLSRIFGDSNIEIIKNPVKRNAEHIEPHDAKPPQVTVQGQNYTHNHSAFNDDNETTKITIYEKNLLHHPGTSGKEENSKDDQNEGTYEKPIHIRKKSIDWSDYFGIDKRKMKSVNDLSQDRFQKQYLDTFNKEVMYPLSSFRKHTYTKRNFVKSTSDEHHTGSDTGRDIYLTTQDKRITQNEKDTKPNNLDEKLKAIESMIVDDALRYSDLEEKLDTKEEQEMKEQLLSRLAAAYSLEKMRKALNEFKESLPSHQSDHMPSPMPTEDVKDKRVAVKRDNVKQSSNNIPIFSRHYNKNDDFEDEQGAGHYLNGQMEQQFSEGYMGGSGRHRSPVMSTATAVSSCPILAKIIQRCRNVDMLAGDRGQLFLPLCSFHQICYLCGKAPPTTCDLAFLSEADTTCEEDMACEQAARSALMELRELHDGLADEMDGECEAPCLENTLKLNIGWQKAIQQ